MAQTQITGRLQPIANSAHQRWTQLDNKRTGMLNRFEKYASVTIPKVCLPDGVEQYSSEISHDWTSVGAQAVNHLTNKIVLNLFRPGVPFFRVDMERKELQRFAAQGVTEEDIRKALVSAEQDAMRVMDQKAIRPLLHETVRHLIVTGNFLQDFTDDARPRGFGIRHYVVKRSISGAVQEVLIHEPVMHNELVEEVQALIPSAKAARDNEQTPVHSYRWYKKTGKKWEMTRWVDDYKLPEDYHKTYTEQTLPIRVLVWDLSDEHDYGTGLVEDYAGDFGTLSILSESEIKTAILASDYRWLANPASIGNVQDIKTSQAGDVIAGAKDDLSLIALASVDSVTAVANSAERVIRRIGSAFLLGSAVTRDAERVTAEEIRMQAQELESSLGGVYSRLAIEFQQPIALWLLDQVGVDIRGTKFVPTIITGLAALSRNTEAGQLMQFLTALGNMATLPPEVLTRLQLTPVIGTLAAAYGIDPDKFVKPEQQVQQEQAAQQQAAVNQQVTVDAAKAAAQGQAQAQARNAE